MSSKLKTKRIVSVLLAVLMIAGIVAMTMIPASADSINASVKEDANGVLQIRTTALASGKLSVDGSTYSFQNEPLVSSSGTSFLINSTTVLTCAHVVNPDELEKVVTKAGLKFESVKYEVVINKDVTVPCSLETMSVADDYAVLTLNKAIGTKTVLKLADTSDIAPTQKVYALGFPGVITEMQKEYDSENVTYDKEDVTITEGEIQKLTSINNTRVIQHGCATSGGNSGGPIVNEDGAVLGVHKWGDPESNNSYHYATDINEIRKVLDTLLIDYELWPGQGSIGDKTETSVESEEPTTAPLPTSEPTKVDSTDSKPIKESGTDVKTIIIVAIIALVVILIAVVVVIIIISSKKKGGNGPTGGAGGTGGPVLPPTNPPEKMVPPTPPVGPSFVMPSGEGAGETSVLSDGAGETTLLGGQATGFSILRKSTNETIAINKPEFTIGKERRRVDYCIDNNNSVSRTHARLHVRSGVCYISDLGSTNCTYVNGTRLSPNQEIALKKGDKIKISDEEFEFFG